MDWNPPGLSVHGILQARILEWAAMPPPGDLPDPGMEPVSLTSPALAGEFFTTSATRWNQIFMTHFLLFYCFSFYQLNIYNLNSEVEDY